MPAAARKVVADLAGLLRGFAVVSDVTTCSGWGAGISYERPDPAPAG